MNDFLIENGTLKLYQGDKTKVTIPGEVTRIGAQAFKDCNIVSVSFSGNNLKSIDSEAFINCDRLESIEIPNGVVQIGERAFYGCKNIEYISIPNSIILIGDSILENTNNKCFVIGQHDTEAEKVSKKYGLVLKTDKKQAINSKKKLDILKKKNVYEEFEIFGETIVCCKSIQTYDDISKKYSQINSALFKSFWETIPKKIDDKYNKAKSIEILEKEKNNCVQSLSNCGIFIEDKELESYTSTSLKKTIESLDLVIGIFDKLTEAVNSDISQNKEKMLHEAESKITGLSYGVIGNKVDLLFHALQDNLTRRDQAEEAYRQAGYLHGQYIAKETEKGNDIYQNFLNRAKETLEVCINSFVDGLYNAELDFLFKNQILDKLYIESIDTKKSNEIFAKIENHNQDNSIALALALKKYPYNLSVIDYAIKHGYYCDGLSKLLDFLDIKAKCFDIFKDYVTKRPAIKNQFELIKESKSFFKNQYMELLNFFAIRTTRYIELISTKTSTCYDKENITNSCKDVLSNILPRTTYDYLLSNGVNPIQGSNKINANDYDSLITWFIEAQKNAIEQEKIRKEKEKIRKEEEKIRKEKEKARIERIKKTVKKYSFIISATAIFILTLIFIVIPPLRIKKAIKYYENGDYGIAIKLAYKCDSNIITSKKAIKIISESINEIEQMISIGDYENAYYHSQSLEEDDYYETGRKAYLLYTGNYSRAVREFSMSHIVIPEGTTSIADGAFSRCSSLKSITIPDSVTSIGGDAFSGCSSLTSITIPDSVTSIGSDAFYGCSSLKSITIPDSVTSIGRYAFYNCSSLKSITIPDSVTSIGYDAFFGCRSLVGIEIPDRVTSIDHGAFCGCSSLESITIPDSVTSIGRNAFYGCSKLTIYAEAASKPSGWDSSWNSSGRPVVWGYE